MFKNLRKLGLAFGVAVSLVGCASAPQQPVSLAAGALSGQSGKVGVALAAMPKPDLHLPGADCLLCIAFATAANSSLNSHSQALPVEDLVALRHDAAEALRAKGVNVLELPDELKIADLPSAKGTTPNSADRDYLALKQKYQLDRLVVLSIERVGTERTYASYIPTSDAKAVVRGRGYMVDLSSNTYLWYLPVTVVKASDGKWDEPPKFPGLSNAYFQAVESARDQLLQPLGR